MTDRAEAVCIIVDDDPDVCRIIRHPLQRRGISAIVCGSTAELQAALGKVKPGLIFLDAGLPDTGTVDPFDALAGVHCNAWIQLISGKSQPELAELALEGEDWGLRMLPPLTKPFPNGAIATVVDLIGSSSTEVAR